MSPTGAIPAPCRPYAAAGFTLVELMVVVAVIALVVRLAVANLGALVPSSILDGECRSLRAHADFLRSEARLRGQTHTLDLDLDRHRYRYVLPPERRLASYEEEVADWPLTWKPLDERVQFHGVANPGRPLIEHGIYRLQFDEAGQTADVAIFLRLATPGADYVWTLQLRGLSGRSDILKSVEGKRHVLEEVNEGAF